MKPPRADAEPRLLRPRLLNPLTGHQFDYATAWMSLCFTACFVSSSPTRTPANASAASAGTAPSISHCTWSVTRPTAAMPLSSSPIRTTEDPAGATINRNQRQHLGLGRLHFTEVALHHLPAALVLDHFEVAHAVLFSRSAAGLLLDQIAGLIYGRHSLVLGDAGDNTAVEGSRAARASAR